MEETSTSHHQSHVSQEQAHRRQPRISRHGHTQPPHVAASYRLMINASNVISDGVGRNNAWSCLVVLLTFWFFVCMTLIFGLYGSFNLQLGPNCSYMIRATPIFVRAIKVQQVSHQQERSIFDQTNGSMLYGFHKFPALNVKTTWSQNHTASIEPNIHTEWAYYLNVGSQINISYNVRSPKSTYLYLVVTQGKEALFEWIDYPTYANSTSSWKVITGKGNISQNIKESDRYFVAVGNLNSETVEVNLCITIGSIHYNTSNPYFKCSLTNHACTFKLHFTKPNAAVLTSPLEHKVNNDEDWYFKVTFEPMWVTYIGGSCFLTVIILGLFQLCSMIESNNRSPTESRTQHDPLLARKCNDSCSSQCSSYDSLTNDDEDIEENLLEASSTQGKLTEEGDSNTNSRRMCIICFEAPRDCFFLPCGHCAACFTCGSRMAEEAGTCPICRRKMKKVRKIFPV